MNKGLKTTKVSESCPPQPMNVCTNIHAIHHSRWDFLVWTKVVSQLYTSVATNITCVMSPELGQLETFEHPLTKDLPSYYMWWEIWLNWVGWWKSCHVAGRQTDRLCPSRVFTHCCAKVRLKQEQENPISTLLPHHCHQPHRNTAHSV